MEKIMLFEFFQYQKIYDDYNIQKLNREITDSIEWYVEEKVHGANLSIYNNGINCIFAKRYSFIEETDNFFGYKILKNDLIIKTNKIYEILKNKYILDYVIVYGELINSVLPHMETNLYSPNLHFMAFDIASVFNSKINFLNRIEFTQNCVYADFFYSMPLFYGKYDEAIKYKLNFNSTIPSKLGIEYNMAEGIIIRPSREIYYKDKNKKLVRYIIKRKHNNFRENIIDKHNLHPCDIILSMINVNRYNSIKSKYGKISNYDMINYMTDDILEDYYLNYSDIDIDNFNDFYTLIKNGCKDYILSMQT